jgi:eukaryotic-like serine/threonine-protein kinase
MSTIKPRTSQEALLGQNISGRYSIIEQIGEGGMGTVYKARQEPLGRVVAFKVLLPELVDDSLKLKRFVNEARILSGLRHPHTVSLIDFGRLSDGRLYIVMDYVHGGTLRDLMDQGRIAQIASLSIIRQVLQSLSEAHGLGIIHRDLKPANVLVDDVENEQFVIRVADFGIAKLDANHEGRSIGIQHTTQGSNKFGVQAHIATSPGIRLGTPAYIPPEQAFGKPIDARSDLYSVGVLLYEMLTGHQPFSSDTERGLCLEHLHTKPKPVNSVNDALQIDPQVELLLLRLMAKDMDERPSSAKSVIRVIDEVLARLSPAGSSKTIPLPVVLPGVNRSDVTEDDEPIYLERSGVPQWVWGALIGLIVGGLATTAMLLR